MIHSSVDIRGNLMRLLRLDLPGDEPFVAIEVKNATRERDGTFNTYTLRVHPQRCPPMRETCSTSSPSAHRAIPPSNTVVGLLPCHDRVVERGSHFTSTRWGLVRIARADECVLLRVNYNERLHALPHRATMLHDLVSTGDLVAALFSTATETRLASVDAARTRLDQPVIHGARRVAVTDALTFVASDWEVVDVDGPCRPVIAGRLHDIAASSFELAVVTDDGVSFFDARGNPVANQPLTGASAIAEQRSGWSPRPEERRWLVAAGGDVLAIERPGALPAVVARGVGAVARLRAGPNSLHVVSPEGVLTEVLGGRPKVIATFEPGWVDFELDPTFNLHVDEGKGPVRFWAKTECGCRTRTVKMSWDPDAGYVFVERATCPVCGRSWVHATYERTL